MIVGAAPETKLAGLDKGGKGLDGGGRSAAVAHDATMASPRTLSARPLDRPSASPSSRPSPTRFDVRCAGFGHERTVPDDRYTGRDERGLGFASRSGDEILDGQAARDEADAKLFNRTLCVLLHNG